MKNIIDRAAAKEFEALIEGSRNIVVTCHVRPDGDAMGSSLALCRLLQKLGKEARVVVPDQPPRNLQFLPGFADIAIYSRYDPYCSRLVNDADLIVCCDFNKPSRQDHLEPLIQNAKCPKVLIDHHQFPDDFATVTFSFPEMSSTCELAFRVIAAMGLYGEVDKEIATCLTAGLITDTRNFSVNCKDPEIYEVLMRLLEKGVDKEKIVKETMMTRTYGSVKLQAYAITDKLEIFEQDRAAVITLDQEELKRFHYEKGDSEGLVNVPLDISGMVYCIFLREDADCIKVSARSVNGFPVSKICEDLYGGGGHIQAAGGEFHGTLEECRRILIENMARYRKYIPQGLPKLQIPAPAK